MTPSADESRPGYLEGLRVLELGDGVAGAAATAVLADLGAHVEKARSADCPALDQESPPALSVVLDRGKSVIDLPASLSLSSYDLVVCDRFGGRVEALPSDPEAYLRALQELAPPAAVTISAYGLRGRRRDWSGSEITVGAAAALYATDPSSGSPVKLGGYQAMLGAGHVAALAACHVIDLSRRRGTPAHADLSAHEAAIAIGPTLRLAHALFRCVGAAGSRRNGAPAGFYRCRDGEVRISAMENHQYQALCRAFGNPAWAGQFANAAARIDRAGELDRLVSAQIADWSKADCEARLQREGVPATAMYEVADLLHWPQFAARAAFEPLTPAAQKSGCAIRPPVRVAKVQKTDRVNQRPAGLAGLRIAEAGHVLAVPLATSLLGALGASVTKLEDPHRIDVYRRRGPYIDGSAGEPRPDGSPGLERSAYFAAVNHSKRSVSLDLEADRVELDALLADHDVLVENLGPSRARRLRLDAASATEDHPHLLAISSSGYGHYGPWSSYRAYAYNLHAACGLCSQTRTAAGEPAEIDLAWGDLITAYAIATVIAAWAIGDPRASGNQRRSIDFSMAELLSARFNERIAELTAGLPAIGRSRPRLDGYYRTADQRWVAVSVSTDDQWANLCRVLGCETSVYEAGRSADLRARQASGLAASIAGRLAAWPAADVASALQANGVAAAVAASIEDLLNDAHLSDRGFFPTVEHPVWGTNRVIGLPWSVVGEKPIALGAPPIFGSTAYDAAVRADS